MMPISVSAFLISSQVHLNIEDVQVFVYFEGNKTKLHVARGQRLFGFFPRYNPILNGWHPLHGGCGDVVEENSVGG